MDPLARSAVILGSLTLPPLSMGASLSYARLRLAQGVMDAPNVFPETVAGWVPFLLPGLVLGGVLWGLAAGLRSFGISRQRLGWCCGLGCAGLALGLVQPLVGAPFVTDARLTLVSAVIWTPLVGGVTGAVSGYLAWLWATEEAPRGAFLGRLPAPDAPVH